MTKYEVAGFWKLGAFSHKFQVRKTNGKSMMLRKLMLLVAAVLVVGCDRGAKPATGGGAMPFAAGQIWTYQTRAGEEASRIVICRVESDVKLGQIVHVHVNGLRFKNKHAPGGVSSEIGHMPYSASALQKCLVKVESSSAALPKFEEGYDEWRRSFDQHRAGIWTAPVPEAISMMESAINQ